ncbi:MAG: septum formation inhibitor Maf [Bacteroidota bacterium]|nr:septum formation inhibitor Maf [Bacteroidota bacterium]
MTKKIILASKSPRRFELMKMAGLEFIVDSKNVEEIHPVGIPVELIPEYLAKKKVDAYINDIDDNTVVIGADTVVILEGIIFEKPENREHAIEMLLALSGKMHQVVTGVCTLSKQKEVAFSETTKVYFNELSREEIEFYVDGYKPYDKAGSYACQEWIGAVGIKRFEGDYFNVVGLPINRVYSELKKF